MSGSKHFDKIAWTVTALILVITILFMNGASFGLEAMAHTMGYEERLFDNTKVHTIDIVMDDWDEFIADATSEEYYTAAMVIDGESFKNVAIRGKGNTSLSTVSSMNSDRYSFKVEFDHYDSSITYHGLDKLSLNNLIQDSTMMKDYLTYTMMNEFDAEAPLCSYVYITVNGEDWGLYLAVEGVEDSFLERNYGTSYGELYKPDSMSFGGGRGNGKDFDMNDFMNSARDDSQADGNTAMPQMPDMGGFDISAMFGSEMPDMSNFDPSSMQGPTGDESGFGNDGRSSSGGGFSFGGMGGFGMGSSDVKLQYIDDDPDSYSNIWNNAKTDITTADQTRLIESLKKLSNKEQIESVVDIDSVIRYFVVHNYVCNGDSYTGSMIHNYYLYEENGRMSMIPWDYNLAFGTFQGGSAQSTVNTPIDAPVSGGSGEDRPMWSWILSDESYTQMYHEYFAEFLNTVDIQSIIDNAYNLIKAYAEKDPTAFYTYEEFEKGVETMRSFCELRSESISMQLANGETASNMSYVDASDLNVSDMGSMGGGFGGGMPGQDGNKLNFGGRGSSDEDTSDKSDADNSSSLSVQTLSVSSPSRASQSMQMSAMQGGFGGMMPDMGEMPEGFDPSQMPDMGNMPEGFDPSQMPEGFDPSSMPEGFGGMFGGDASDSTETTPQDEPDNENPATQDNRGNADSSEDGNSPSRDNMQMPSGNRSPGMSGTVVSDSTNLILLVVSVLILGAGLLIAKLYKNY